jgi:hypothetical protein
VTSTPTILYPIARGQDGAAVHIDAWERGQVVTCFGCEQELVGRMPHDGIKPTAHFAHKADATCGGETALHRATKAAITHAHAAGTLQFLSWECPRCARTLHRTDLRSLTLHEEARPCDGVVTDVLGLDHEKPRVALEIVVTHDIEAETMVRYQALGIEVLSICPSWVILGDVVRGSDVLHVVHRAGVFDAASCEGCQEVLREKAEWELRAQKQRAMAWWSAWGEAWLCIAKEARAQGDVEQRLLEVQRRRDQVWWTAWGRTWPRIGNQIIDAWWIAWRGSWLEIAAQYAAPYRWKRAWQEAWRSISQQHVAEETQRAREREDEDRRSRLRRRNWWETWARVWTDIGQRESGLKAAWKPICRNCRADLTPEHRCP